MFIVDKIVSEFCAKNTKKTLKYGKISFILLFYIRTHKNYRTMKTDRSLAAKIFLLGAWVLLAFCPGSYAQTTSATYVYDSTGIAVDIAKDLSETPVELPGTRAKMRLPKYFEAFAFENKSGFLHEGTSSSILSYEYPGVAFTSITNQMSDSTFLQQGAELLEVLDIKQADGKIGKAYIVRFETPTAPVIRIIYFTGDYQTTFYLIANIPEVVSKLLRNVILESFKTIEF
jgi:hypothetical protein